MSVLMEQHQDYVGARYRLGMPIAPTPRVRRDLIPPKARKIRVLPNYAPFNFYSRPSHEMIIRIVALKHGLRYYDILGRVRTKAVAAARREAVCLVYSHCGPRSMHQMGRLFHRDHTSILNMLGRLKGKGRMKSTAARLSPTINTTHTQGGFGLQTSPWTRES